MGQFRGTLLISGSQSSVNGNVLLMAGDQDPNLAMSDATSFVKRKGFQSGFAIVVTGTLGQVGPTNGIIMTDAAAPAARPIADMALAPAVTAASPSATPQREKAAAKKKSAKKKSAKKKSAAKKRSPKKRAPRVAKRQAAKKSRGKR
jgi:hypothetical protein